jgi:glycosidase
MRASSASRSEQGEPDVNSLHVYYSWNEKAFPADAMRMLFVSNHDKNAWEGTEFEQFGDALEAAIVLSAVSEGMPLIYNGQEAGNPRRLQFFERDPIDWREHPLGALYRRMFALKKANTALWNAHWGARMIHVPNSAPAQVLSFVRRNERDKVFAVFNFSPEAQTVTFAESLYHGAYTEYLSGEPAQLDADTRLTLGPWGYAVLVQ